MTTKNTLKTVKFSSILWVGKYPGLYYPLLNIQSALSSNFSPLSPGRSDEIPLVIQSRQPVKPDTELVVEGFPRSANTSTVLAFQFAQPKPTKIAYHHHVPAQIIRAVEWGIPTLVLIRDPIDAIASLQHQEILMHHWSLSVQRSLKYYIYFYENIIDLKQSYVIGEFRDVTTSLNPTIAKLNEKFNTNFNPISTIDQNETLKRYQKTPYKSSFAKSELPKERSLAEIFSPLNQSLLDRALAVYRAMICD